MVNKIKEWSQKGKRKIERCKYRRGEEMIQREDNREGYVEKEERNETKREEKREMSR